MSLNGAQNYAASLRGYLMGTKSELVNCGNLKNLTPKFVRRPCSSAHNSCTRRYTAAT